MGQTRACFVLLRVSVYLDCCCTFVSLGLLVLFAASLLKKKEGEMGLGSGLEKGCRNIVLLLMGIWYVGLGIFYKLDYCTYCWYFGFLLGKGVGRVGEKRVGCWVCCTCMLEIVLGC